jgi:ornithine carbamoyltransferase
LLCSKRRGDAALAFERAVTGLGGTATVLDADEWRTRTAYGVQEAAKMLGRLYDAIDCCDLPPSLVEQIETHVHVPVFNGLAQGNHPLRMLGELLTMREVGRKPLHQQRLWLSGGAAPSEEMARLARLAGVQVTAKDALTVPTATELSTDNTPDFILNDAANEPTDRLAMHDASPADRTRLTGLLVENDQCALQALLMCGMQ